MPTFKRKRPVSRPSVRSVSYPTRAKRARMMGTTGYAGVMRASLNRRISRVERTIETKDGLSSFSGTNVALPHNNLVTLNSQLLKTENGSSDPMAGIPQRIGDSLVLKGLAIKMLLQNQAERPRVFYRIMVIKSAKGDAPTRATLFKGINSNKMLDQINTERYTILAQKVLNLTAVGSQAWTTAGLGGQPQTGNGGTIVGGIGTKIISMWVPGKRFMKYGRIQYENQSIQPKFYDYTLCVMAYDWFGTPQDINNVGAVSDGWIKMYYKDA